MAFAIPTQVQISGSSPSTAAAAGCRQQQQQPAVPGGANNNNNNTQNQRRPAAKEEGQGDDEEIDTRMHWEPTTFQLIRQFQRKIWLEFELDSSFQYFSDKFPTSNFVVSFNLAAPFFLFFLQ